MNIAREILIYAMGVVTGTVFRRLVGYVYNRMKKTKRIEEKK